MSTIGPTEPTVAAAPTQPTGQPVGDAAPAKPGEGFAPLAALQDERDNTRQAREQASLLRAHMELAGWTFGEDGTPAPPQPRQPDPPAQAPQIPPRVHALATSLGVDPMEFLGAMAEAFGPMASSFAAPMAEGNAELYKTITAGRDPDYEVYAKSIDKHLAYVPVNWRGSAKAMEIAIQNAKAEHLDELVKRRVERERNPGKVVGRFTEGAAPGTTEGPAPSLSPEAQEWARRQGVSEELIAKAAANPEVSRRSR